MHGMTPVLDILSCDHNIYIFRNEGRETRSEYDRKVDKVKEEWQTEVKTLKKQHEDELKKVKVSFFYEKCL